MRNFGPESTDPRIRRAFAHAQIANLRAGKVSHEEASAAVAAANQTRKGANSGFEGALRNSVDLLSGEIAFPQSRYHTEVTIFTSEPTTVATRGNVTEGTIFTAGAAAVEAAYGTAFLLKHPLPGSGKVIEYVSNIPEAYTATHYLHMSPREAVGAALIMGALTTIRKALPKNKSE